MKLFVVLLFSLIAASSAHRLPPGLAQLLTNLNYVQAYTEDDYAGRIVGGTETTIASHPHQLVMLRSGSFICGGSIISTAWALSAAHCLDDYPSVRSVQFRAGSTDRTQGGLLVTATEYHIHPKYDIYTASYDAAVVKVTPSFSGTSIRPIPLPSSGVELVSGTTVTVTGWGRTETGSLPTRLQVKHTDGGRIVGGSETTIASHPHQLAMIKNGAFKCGASIIASQWALTAAHCIDDYPAVSRIQFRAGSTDRTWGGLLVTATAYHLHPKYDKYLANYDVAVVKVSPSFSGINIRPIPLVAAGTELSAGTSVLVTGWGYTDSWTVPTNLRVVYIPIVGYDTCKLSWGGNLFPTMFCAGVSGKDSCDGDSGGPLVQGGMQHGIVSFGDENCRSARPGVYAKISNSEIRSFIRTMTGV
uniref:CSON005753 protein n=1 Tax=Culicoides sonorensis TaxID=179676 RepID=A0A336LV69_CULSO